MRIYVRFPRDEGNRVVEFKDMPKIGQPMYFTDKDGIYKVTEITRDRLPEPSILIRKGGL